MALSTSEILILPHVWTQLYIVQNSDPYTSHASAFLSHWIQNFSKFFAQIWHKKKKKKTTLFFSHFTVGREEGNIKKKNWPYDGIVAYIHIYPTLTKVSKTLAKFWSDTFILLRDMQCQCLMKDTFARLQELSLLYLDSLFPN